VGKTVRVTSPSRSRPLCVNMAQTHLRQALGIRDVNGAVTDENTRQFLQGFIERFGRGIAHSERSPLSAHDGPDGRALFALEHREHKGLL
jgi:hypothetical protein